MQLSFRLAVSGLLLGTIALVPAGCAGTQNADPWARLNLPSPSATIKAAEGKASAKQASSADAQLSLDILRGRGLERSGDFEKARRF